MSTLTIQDVAKKLDKSEYGDEGSEALWRDCKRHGIVVVFGASDDLMEFRGAIYDEVGAYDGTEVKLTEKGLCGNLCPNDNCPNYHEPKGAKTIKAIFGPTKPECTFIYETEIPHVPFDVMEDGELYCVGIVFRLEDAKA